MKTAGQSILSDLKNPEILTRKPFLKICSNHRRDMGPRIYRIWNNGTAKSDGRGWYVPFKKESKIPKLKAYEPDQMLKEKMRAAGDK